MIVKISNIDNQNLMKVHYEYLLKKEILGDLITNGIASKETIQNFMEEVTLSKIKTEQLKEQLVEKYQPDSFEYSNYSFNFIRSEIEFS